MSTLQSGSGSRRLDLALVLALCLAAGTLWATIMPPLQTPDELAHFIYVQFLAEEGRLPGQAGRLVDTAPELDDFWQRMRFDEVRFHHEVLYRPDTAARSLPRHSTNGISSASGYPPGYYALAALGYRTVLDRPIETRFYAARFVSVLLGLATVAAAWVLGCQLMPDSRSFPIALALLTGLQPMASMLSASVNNDALLIPAAAWTIVLALRSDPARASARALLVLGLVIGIGLLAKPQAAFVALCATLLLLGRAFGGARPWRSSLRAALLMGLGAAAVFGWWAAFALRRFGSPLGMMEFHQTGTLSGSLGDYLRMSIFSGSALSKAFALWVRNYWACFGWLDTPFESAVPYVVIALSMALAAAGLARALARRQEPGRGTIGLLLGFVLCNLAFLYAFEARHVHLFHAEMLQGRYLFTALLPAGALLLLGWRSLVPERARPFVDGVAVIGILVLHVASLRLIVERYYGIAIG